MLKFVRIKSNKKSSSPTSLGDEENNKREDGVSSSQQDVNNTAASVVTCEEDADMTQNELRVRDDSEEPTFNFSPIQPFPNSSSLIMIRPPDQVVLHPTNLMIRSASYINNDTDNNTKSLAQQIEINRNRQKLLKNKQRLFIVCVVLFVLALVILAVLIGWSINIFISLFL